MRGQRDATRKFIVFRTKERRNEKDEKQTNCTERRRNEILLTRGQNNFICTSYFTKDAETNKN